jgi:hypothetical protein
LSHEATTSLVSELGAKASAAIESLGGVLISYCDAFVPGY